MSLKTRKIIFTVFVLLLLASMSSAGYFYWQLRNIKNNPNTVTQDENKKLIEKLGKLILLPNEEPTIATVTDPAKLADQTFFANAKVGYKVLVYSVAKKAILYDPVANKVIEVGPVNITQDQSNSGTSAGTVPVPVAGSKTISGSKTVPKTTTTKTTPQ